MKCVGILPSGGGIGFLQNQLVNVEIWKRSCYDRLPPNKRLAVAASAPNATKVKAVFLLSFAIISDISFSFISMDSSVRRPSS
mmetsp:Transcript_23230/g.33805  ORF Transcript_23230/g.33805 Transcript_23230/m.33805 type:complete len:83 (-) Transcript_23230:85-333(-)